MPSLITLVIFTLMPDIFLYFLGAIVGNSGAAALCSRIRSEVYSLPNVDRRPVRYGFRQFRNATEGYTGAKTVKIATGIKLLENHKPQETLLFSSFLPRNPYLETKLWLIVSPKRLGPST